jgi:hypothetical protein
MPTIIAVLPTPTIISGAFTFCLCACVVVVNARQMVHVDGGCWMLGCGMLGCGLGDAP